MTSLGRIMRLAAVVLLFGGLDGQARAARPFVTDDARLTVAGSCQLETWTRLYAASLEYWTLPACNPGGNFELTAGAGLAAGFGEEHTFDYMLQGKTLLRTLRDNDWGLGLAFGSVIHPQVNPGPNLLGNFYAYLPVSRSFRDGDVVTHGNLGWLRDYASDRDKLTWGFGAEVRLSDSFVTIAEVFGDSQRLPYAQMGLRYGALPNLLQIDSTIGLSFSGIWAEHWLSIGLRYTPASVF